MLGVVAAAVELSSNVLVIEIDFAAIGTCYATTHVIHTSFHKFLCRFCKRPTRSTYLHSICDNVVAVAENLKWSKSTVQILRKIICGAADDFECRIRITYMMEKEQG